MPRIEYLTIRDGSVREINDALSRIVRVINELDISASAGLVWRGAWNAGTDYFVNDLVEHDGALYVATDDSTGSEPPSADWDLVFDAPVSGGGSGFGLPSPRDGHWLQVGRLTAGGTPGAGGNVTPVLNRAYLMPFVLQESRTVDTIAFFVVSQSSGGTGRIALYDSVDKLPGSVIAESADIATTPGQKTLSPSNLILTPGQYWATLGFKTSSPIIRGLEPSDVRSWSGTTSNTISTPHLFYGLGSSWTDFQDPVTSAFSNGLSTAATPLVSIQFS